MAAHSFYVVSLDGLMDMRHVEGPISFFEDAFLLCAQLELRHDGKGISCSSNRGYVGSFYAVHEAGGYVHGPYPAQEVAERERAHDAEDLERFENECGNDAGFTGRLIAMIGNFGVIETWRPSML